MALHVLLVHGMARTPLSLRRLAGELRDTGYGVHVVGYVAALESVDRIATRLHSRLEQLAQRDEPYVVLGHSLGGILLRLALARSPALPRLPQHLIMLAPPNQSPRLARRFRGYWPYRAINGQAGQLLADPGFYGALPAVQVPYTIIAGTGGSRGQWSPFGNELNDGIVAVSETACAPDDVVIEIPVWHTYMMNDPRVRGIIQDLLERAAS